MKMVMEIIKKKAEHENHQGLPVRCEKIACIWLKLPKCTNIMIILENGKIGKKNNREKVKFWLQVVTVHG